MSDVVFCVDMVGCVCANCHLWTARDREKNLHVLKCTFVVERPLYRAGRPICRKVLNIMFWEVPLADWLIL